MKLETDRGHDAAGNLTGVDRPDLDRISGKDWGVVYERTALGELLKRWDASDPDETEWERDLLGRVTKRTDPDGKVSTWKWDGAANGKGLPQERTYDGTAFKETYAYHP